MGGLKPMPNTDKVAADGADDRAALKGLTFILLLIFYLDVVVFILTNSPVKPGINQPTKKEADGNKPKAPF